MDSCVSLHLMLLLESFEDLKLWFGLHRDSVDLRVAMPKLKKLKGRNISIHAQCLKKISIT
jgi:hypothetical protein